MDATMNPEWGDGQDIYLLVAVKVIDQSTTIYAAADLRFHRILGLVSVQRTRRSCLPASNRLHLRPRNNMVVLDWAYLFQGSFARFANDTTG